MSEIVIRFEAASRTYGTGRTAVQALHPLDLEIRTGELVAIMGPSGSGKSTLLSLAGALDRPTTGRVSMLGRDVSDLSPKEGAAMRRQAVGFVFQELNLLPGLTAIENVALPLELDGTKLGSARDVATSALEDVGLGGLAERFPDDLSSGEQQRVAIARAFVGSRRVLLADEPTGALDSVAGEKVMRLLRRHCDAGRTAVLVTHDAAHAGWADRVLFLRDGCVASTSGTPHDATFPGPHLTLPTPSPGSAE